MSILHVLNSYPIRGAEIFAADLIKALGDRGWEQAAAVLSKPPQETFARYACATTDIRDERVALIRATTLRRLIRSVGPQVVLAHGGEPLKQSVLALIGTDLPLMYRRINVRSERGALDRSLKKLLLSRLIGRADCVIAVAKAVRQELIDFYEVDPKKIEMIPRALDRDRFQAHRSRTDVRRSLNIGLSEPVIMSMCALVWEKDPLALIRVADDVLSHVPEARFVLAGDGPMRSEVEAAIALCKNAGRITYLGYRSDVADLLSACDVFLMTSIVEGLPGSLIEAGMIGVPSVAYSVGGVAEVLIDQQTGLVVRPGDEAGLSHALLSLLADPERRRLLGEAARVHCEERFSIGPVADRFDKRLRVLGAYTSSV